MRPGRTEESPTLPGSDAKVPALCLAAGPSSSSPDSLPLSGETPLQLSALNLPSTAPRGLSSPCLSQLPCTLPSSQHTQVLRPLAPLQRKPRVDRECVSCSALSPRAQHSSALLSVRCSINTCRTSKRLKGTRQHRESSH